MLKVWKSGKRGYFCTRNQATFLPSTETEGLKKKSEKDLQETEKGHIFAVRKTPIGRGRKGRRKKRFKIFFKSLAGSENNRTFAPASREAKE